MPEWAELLPEDPRTAGPHQVVARLGCGGQGTVYVGVTPDGARVAIKLLHPHLSLDEQACDRFLGEVEAAMRVARFCTVQVIGSGMLRRGPYIVSEYVDGPSLLDAVVADGPRTGAALDRLAINTATALAAIHRARIVHRDFKPANVLLGPDGPVVNDFGIARELTSSGSTTSQVLGTLPYMAPEQTSHAPIRPPSDMFAWGVTMVYAAGAVEAFTGETVSAIGRSIRRDEPDLGGLTGQLRRVVQQCLAKDPAERPTAEEVAIRLLEQTGARWKRPPRRNRSRRWTWSRNGWSPRNRNRWAMRDGGLGPWWWQRSRAPCCWSCAAYPNAVLQSYDSVGGYRTCLSS